MLAAELLGTDVVDERGRRLGRVHDIVLTRRSHDGEWRIGTLVVGVSAVAYRLGYVQGSVRGPAALKTASDLLGRLLGRRRHFQWEQVISYSDGRLIVRDGHAGRSP